jgi:hypothetical protein
MSGLDGLGDKSRFKKGTIGEYWKTIEPENWFDPEFRDFINNEIVGREKLAG